MSKPRNARAELEHADKLAEMHWHEHRVVDFWRSGIPDRAKARRLARDNDDMLRRVTQFTASEARRFYGFDEDFTERSEPEP